MGITCGHCHEKHDTIDEVRVCSKLVAHTPDTTTNPQPGLFANPATDRQKRYLRTLMAEREDPVFDYTGSAWLDESMSLHSQLWAHLAKDDASRMIRHLLSLPMKKVQSSGTPASHFCETPDAGIYRRDGIIFKVYKTVHGAGKMCAKELILDGSGKPEWKYRGLAYKLVSAGDRMTLDEAKEFGAIYGVCCVCGRTLTKEESIEAGIGPVCAEKI